MKSFKSFLIESNDLHEEKDACYRKAMASYGKWSARAAQATAKCRKGKGNVKKSKEGANLKRWEAEDWKDTKTGKDCGAGGKNEYCRPSKRVSKKTPKTSKIGSNHATFSGNEYMFIEWMYKVKPEFEYNYIRLEDSFTILFDGNKKFADDILKFIRNDGHYTLINKNWN